jgi:hypothetical protein
VRELDERLGFSEFIGHHLTDSPGKNTQLPLADGGGGQANRSKSGRKRDRSLSNRFKIRCFLVFPLPGRGGSRPFLSRRSRSEMKGHERNGLAV